MPNPFKDDKQRDEFLASPRLAILMTNNQGRSPIGVPVWFEWTGTIVQMFAANTSPKLGRIKRDPNASVLVTNAVGESEAWVAFDGRIEISDHGGEAFSLARRLLDEGWEVTVETSGHISLASLDQRAVAVMDIKAPGSGESDKMDWGNLNRLRARDEAKFVLADRADYEWARELVRERDLAARCTVLFSPVHGGLDPGPLAEWILEDALPVRLQLQLHKFLWPGVERGV